MIREIGVELEGGWNRDPDYPVHHDGSVEFSPREMKNIEFMGEIASKPYETLAQVRSFLYNAYPTTTNKTCGMHVHISVENKLEYMELMEPDFNRRHFLPAMERMGRELCLTDDHVFWQRLAGHNHFCRRTFQPERQCYETDHYYRSRYCQLNYCWARHGTIECRLFPMFESHVQAYYAVSMFVESVNRYLGALARRPQAKSRHVNIQMPEEDSDMPRIETVCV